MNVLRFVLLSICAGHPDESCGVVMGAKTVPEEFSGVSHGICERHVARYRAQMKSRVA